MAHDRSYYHPNSEHHPDNVWRATVEADHLEALGEHVRREVMKLVASYGFDIEHDHWGTERTMLRHRTSNGGYDFETPLGESE